MKKLLMCCVLVCCLFPCCAAYAQREEAEPTEQILEEYARKYGEELQDGLTQAQRQGTDELPPGFRAEELLKEAMTGGAGFSVGSTVQWVFRRLWQEVFAVGKLMAFVLALSLLGSCLSSLGDGFGGEGTSRIAHFACYVMAAGMAASAFYETVTYGRAALESMAVFMQVLIPLVITALLSSGAVVTAAVLEPTLLAVIEITLVLLKDVFLPLLLLTAAVSVVGGLSEKLRADKLVGLLNQMIKWGLSVMLLIFVGVAGVQSIASASADGLSVKVTKFAASNLVPVVGGILADSVETVVNCGVLLKNAVGVAGSILLAGIAVVPLIRIAACLILFRITAAAAQPVADAGIVKGISSLADSVGILFSMVAAVAVMFIIVLAVLVNAGSMAVMLGR